MWLRVGRSLITDKNRAFSKVGKALMLCQNFDQGCRLTSALIVTYLKTKQEGNSDWFNDFQTQLEELFDKKLGLGPSIGGLERSQSTFISEKDIEILDKARNSRNYICHDLFKDAINKHIIGDDSLQIDSKLFKKHIESVAAGDYLISKWDYEFEEEAAAPYREDEYINDILKWIGF